MYYKHLRVHKCDVHQLILAIDKTKIEKSTHPIKESLNDEMQDDLYMKASLIPFHGAQEMSIVFMQTFIKTYNYLLAYAINLSLFFFVFQIDFNVVLMETSI